MNREEKKQIVDSLAEKISAANNIYITDISTLTVEKANQLRRICFEKGITMQVAKNTLIEKAMLQAGGDYEALIGTLVGSTAIMFSEVGNVPAKVIKDFRKQNSRPLIKSASIMSEIYVGDNQLDALVNIKSKNELIGEIIGMLQAPAGNIISALVKHAEEKGDGKVEAKAPVAEETTAAAAPEAPTRDAPEATSGDTPAAEAEPSVE
jgi:large subunit ribosomal protein L10